LQNAYSGGVQDMRVRCLFAGIALQEVAEKMVRNFRLYSARFSADRPKRSLGDYTANGRIE
jgi:hypothetical protein